MSSSVKRPTTTAPRRTARTRPTAVPGAAAGTPRGSRAATARPAERPPARPAAGPDPAAQGASRAVPAQSRTVPPGTSRAVRSAPAKARPARGPQRAAGTGRATRGDQTANKPRATRTATASPASRPSSAAANGAAAAPRTPFVLLVVGLLGGALVSLLLLNTVLAKDAFSLTALKRGNKQLTQQQQALEEEIAWADSPEALADKARELGMVPASTPRFVTINGAPSTEADPRSTRGALATAGAAGVVGLPPGAIGVAGAPAPVGPPAVGRAAPQGPRQPTSRHPARNPAATRQPTGHSAFGGPGGPR